MSLPASVGNSDNPLTTSVDSTTNNLSLQDQANKPPKSDTALVATAAVFAAIFAIVCLLCIRRHCRKRRTRCKSRPELPTNAPSTGPRPPSPTHSSTPPPHGGHSLPVVSSPPYSRYDHQPYLHQSSNNLPLSSTASSSPTSSLKSPSTYARYWARLFGNKGKRPALNVDPEKGRQQPLSRRTSTLLSRSSSLSSTTEFPGTKQQHDFYLASGKEPMYYGDVKFACPIITLTSPTNSDISIPLQEHFASSSAAGVGDISATEMLEQSQQHASTLLAIPMSTSSSSSASSSASATAATSYLLYTSSFSSSADTALPGPSTFATLSSTTVSGGASSSTFLSAYEKRIAATRQHLEDQHQEHILTDFPPSYEEAIDAGAGVGGDPSFQASTVTSGTPTDAVTASTPEGGSTSPTTAGVITTTLTQHDGHSPGHASHPHPSPLLLRGTSSTLPSPSLSPSSTGSQERTAASGTLAVPSFDASLPQARECDNGSTFQLGRSSLPPQSSSISTSPSSATQSPHSLSSSSQSPSLLSIA
ncbi:hypothetical protein BGW41_002277 [Actinomortierella wolfii]|nr:hypothetical protein BGW41_002277 [Actinomortierella wolfii]